MFWESYCSFHLPNVQVVLCVFVKLVVSLLGFEGETLVLIASVPGHSLGGTLVLIATVPGHR